MPSTPAGAQSQGAPGLPTLSSPPGLPGLPSPSNPGNPGNPAGQGDSGSSADGSPAGRESGAQPGLEPAGGGTEGRAGSSGAAGNLPGQPGGGDYTLDTLPGGVFQGGPGAGSPGGARTAAEQAAILDEQLRRTYETHDEILRREQADARGAGSDGDGGDEPRGGGQGGTRQPGGQAGGGVPNGAGGADVAGNRPGGPPGDGDRQQTFPPPEDIPSGRDDDVVARQLREAAMTEPDPELREALWSEYRNYTGIGDPE